MEEERKVEGPACEDDAARTRRIKADAEKMSDAIFSKETRDHVVRASTEIILAVDSMIPRDKIPEDVKQHYLAAKRETMLLIRSILDAQINMVLDLESKEEPPPEEPGLRKIDLQ
jgi:hypothetical protein